ncbi:uncharacterized protein LOC141633028 [Silene latifolia]|uniref:uncharacterized protein LOC141633028 n=1 Tax=Silene latifolia TaxID=37657 RepID=UPI003D76EA9E
MQSEDEIVTWLSDGQWVLDTHGYTLDSGYNLLRDKFQTVVCHKMVWNNWCMPKHQFIGWLVAREALMLKDKLFSLGLSSDDICILCGTGSENHLHLFQACPYSKRVLELLARLAGVPVPDSNLLMWVEAGQFSHLKKGILLCAAMATFYHLWMQRNRARVEGSLLRPELLRDLITKEVKSRVHSLIKPGISSRDKNWLMSVSLFV